MNIATNIARFEDTPLFALCDTRDEKVRDLLMAIYYGADGMTPTEAFARAFLSESFYLAPDAVDKRTWRLLDDEQQPKTAICNHRGDGKTTRLAARILRNIVLRRRRMILYIQATHEDAAQEMDNVKTELMANDGIVEIFGNMKASTYEDVTKTFGRRCWFACNPTNANKNPGEPFCFILPRGAGQRVRGRNIRILGKRVRPDEIIVDDLEDDEDVLNAESREKLKNWYFGALLRCVRTDAFPDPQTNRWRADESPYRIIHIDTLKHQNALLALLMKSPDWRHVRHAIGRPEEQADGSIKYVSLRPARITDGQLANEASIARMNRTLDVFYREMLCMATARENACWTPDMFQYYPLELDKELQTRDDIVRFIVVDPSRTANQASDLTGILIAAVEPKMGQIYIRRVYGERLTTGEIPNRVLDLAVETNSRIIAVERIGQEGYIDTNFQTAASERKLGVRFLWATQAATPKGDYGTGPDAVKVWRAQQILPDYQAGRVQHHPDLEDSAFEQSMGDYPRCSEWCWTDCAGYIPWVRAQLGMAHMAPRPDRHPNVLQFQERAGNAAMSADIRSGKWSCV